MTIAKEFESNGYAFPLRAMSEEQASAYRTSFEEMEQATTDGKATIRSYGNIAVSFIDEITRFDSILEPVSTILGPDLLVWGASLFVKEARSDTFVSWHQDLTYWGLDGTDEVSAWVALSPATRQSGCMRFIPGSHHRDIVKHRDTFVEQNLLSRGQEIGVTFDESTAVDAVLDPGEFSLHHGHLYHGSNPNESSDRRIGLAIRYISPNMAQRGRHGTMARLVRGEDRYGHFELAPPPSGLLEPEDVQRMLRAEMLQGNYAYEGAAQAGKRRV